MNIHVLDLHFQGRPQCVASFLIEGPTGKFLVECGPSTTLPALQQQLANHGVQPSELEAVLVTHIHLDHAGACGWWAAQDVPIYVHEDDAHRIERKYPPVITALIKKFTDGDQIKVGSKSIEVMHATTP